MERTAFGAMRLRSWSTGKSDRCADGRLVEGGTVGRYIGCVYVCADGTFRCDASAVLDGKTASITRSGVYTVDETENAAAVHLQYENVQYIVDIVCTKDAQGYHLSIAGCDLQPVRAAK